MQLKKKKRNNKISITEKKHNEDDTTHKHKKKHKADAIPVNTTNNKDNTCNVPNNKTITRQST